MNKLDEIIAHKRTEVEKLLPRVETCALRRRCGTISAPSMMRCVRTRHAWR
jgi:CBS-domain-containing membrane protein